MISWIQAFTQKNHKVLFGFLLIVIIIAFVFTIGNLPTFGGGGNYKPYKNTFYGYDLNNQKVTRELSLASYLSAQLQGRMIHNQDMENMLVLTRAVSLHLADRLNIPEPPPEDLAGFLQGLVAFQDDQGNYSRESFLEFLDQLKNNPNLTEATFWKTLQEDWRIQKVQLALRGPGYALPYSAKQEIRMRDTTWSVDVATLNYEDFKFEPELSDEAIAEYYNANQFRYEIPQRAQTSYIFIPADRFLDQVPPVEDEIALETFYQNNRGLFPDKKTFADARAEVVKEYTQRLARREALRFANDEVVLKLYHEDIALNSEAFDALLKTHNLTRAAIAPYTRDGLPQHSVLTQPILSQAFTNTRYYSEPYPVKEGVAILLVESMIDPELMPLETVRDRVAKDLTESLRRDAFIAKGTELRESLQTNTENPEQFPIAAAKLKLDVQPYRDFTLMSPPEGINQVVLSALSSVDVGSVSEMISQRDKGYFVYVVKKQVPELNENDPMVQQYLKRIEIATAQQSASDLINEMIALGLAQAEGKE